MKKRRWLLIELGMFGLLLAQAGVGMILWMALAALFSFRLSSWMIPVAAGLMILSLGLTMRRLGTGTSGLPGSRGRDRILQLIRMIANEKRRTSWSRFRYALHFFATSLLLGLFGTLIVALLDESWVHELTLTITLCVLIIKCFLEAREYLSLRTGPKLPRTCIRGMAALVCASALVLTLAGGGGVGWIVLASIACFLGEYGARSLIVRSALLPGVLML